MKRITTIFLLAVALAVSAIAGGSTPITSDKLAAAKQELTKLRARYTDQHPRVQAQLRQIEDLERQVVAQPQEPTELRAARAELAELRRRYEEQVLKVAELERQAKLRATERAELQAARARFAKVKQRYREPHPEYLEALRTVQELEKQQATRK